MKNNTLTPLAQRQRKALLLLPVILIPFVTLLFWALGGGKGTAAKAQPQTELNFKLPGALLDSAAKSDKLAFYDQAQKDSVARAKERKQDPYGARSADTVGMTPAATANTNEAKIYERLAALQAAANRPTPAVPSQPVNNYEPPVRPSNKVKQAEDPELRQMGQLLEKVMAIQHPELLRNKADSAASKPIDQFRAVPAVVDGKQKITEGSVIRMKLLDTVTLHGQLFPKGQLVFASGSFYNQRFKLHISSLKIGYQIYPVDLTVFDQQDGLEGLCIPEAVTSDALKGGSVNAVEGTQFLSMDASLAAQAATAGINTAKGLFSKKVKAIKAKLADGRRLLLRDNEKLKNNKY